jgi:hypothetical protein
MHHFNNNDSNYNHGFIAVTILTLAIIATSSMAVAPVAVTATTEATTTTTTTAPPASSSGLDLSSQPVFQEQTRDVSENLINETHVETGYTGNGTLNLPNGTEAINTTSTGSILISLMEGAAIGKEVITTEDGSESATAKFFGIARFNMQEGTGRGILIAVFDTNSTARLAPLDDMIMAGHAEFDPEGTTFTTLWEWQSGIPLLTELGTGGTTSPPPTTTANDTAAETTTTTPPTTIDTLGQ